MVRLQLPARDIVGIRAANPGPLTGEGSNSWIVGRDPAWLIDPGPALPDHLAALEDELRSRGGLGGIALTHDHPDHAEGLALLRERWGSQAVAARAPADARPAEGSLHGPLRAVATPGHAPDHFAYLCDGALFSGDAVLGEGSVFIAPDPGALAGYLDALRRLLELAPEVLCPGHGPIVDDAPARLREMLEHRLERERRLRQALASGARSVEEMLDAAWSDAPQGLRPFARATLGAHLDKLAEDGQLPEGVERPEL
jgi:glyoxylase-like metal-dependent hydrolase (beta-lactamase superfamily II)